MTTAVVDYPLAALHLQVISGGMWLRSPPGHLHTQIREYAERMAAGDEFPPVRLTPTGGSSTGTAASGRQPCAATQR